MYIGDENPHGNNFFFFFFTNTGYHQFQCMWVTDLYYNSHVQQKVKNTEHILWYAYHYTKQNTCRRQDHRYDYTRYKWHNPMFNKFITNTCTSLRVIDLALFIDVLFYVEQATLMMHSEWRCQPFYSDQLGDKKYSCISTFTWRDCQ